MKKKYGQYIKRKIKSDFKKEFPEFQFQNQKHSCYQFVKKIGKGWNVIKVCHEENDCFSIGLMWSPKEEEEEIQNVVLVYLELMRPYNINQLINYELKKVSITLADFWADDFDSRWAVDQSGKILECIKQNGYITSDAYYEFFSHGIDRFDEPELPEEQYSIYIDPLIDNAVEMIKKYALPLFEAFEKKEKA